MIKTVMAIGAHTLDAQLTCGMLLAKHAMAGNRIITVDITAGERGAPKPFSTEEFRQMNIEGAKKFAETLGGKSYIMGLPDAELYATKEASLTLAQIMRDEHVDTVLCHWKNSSLCDHAAASEIAVRASFFASLPTFPLHGVPAPISELYYAENWEYMEGFIPYTIFDVSEAFPVWREAVKSLFLAEHAPYFHYLRYYEALSIVRGAPIRADHGSAFAVPEYTKQVIIR